MDYIRIDLHKWGAMTRLRFGTVSPYSPSTYRRCHRNRCLTFSKTVAGSGNPSQKVWRVTGEKYSSSTTFPIIRLWQRSVNPPLRSGQAHSRLLPVLSRPLRPFEHFSVVPRYVLRIRGVLGIHGRTDRFSVIPQEPLQAYWSGRRGNINSPYFWDRALG